MKFVLIAWLLGMASLTAAAQTETTETVTTTDSTGQSATVQVHSISTSHDITPRTNMIVINPLKFFTYFNISYYHAVSSSVALGGGVQTPTGLIESLTDVSLGGIGFNVEMRWHPGRRALHGFYVAPNASFNYLTASYDNGSGTSVDEGSATTYTIGALLGWQWFPGDDFAIGLGLGADRTFISVSSNGETSAFDDYTGFLPAVRFDIGYAWE